MKRILIFTLALAFYMIAGAQTKSKDWAQFYRYGQANPSIKTSPRAVFMGDSITDLWSRNDGNFFVENNFVCRGISGQTTSQMLVRFRKDVLDLKPKYVVILAGTNDIALNNGYISLENILGNIISMCELAKAHKIKPILCSVLPADKYKWRPELKPAEEIVKLNGMIKDYAKLQRYNYVDYHTPLKNAANGLPEKYSSDGVHPNIDCYKIMEKIILEVL